MSITTTTGKAFKVKQVNGYDVEVLTADERAFFNGQKKSYLEGNAYTAPSDVADLDRLLLLELQIFRIQRHLAAGRDYEGNELSYAAESELHKKIKELGPQLSQIKNDLGLTRTQREKEQHESVGAYINDLKVRAKAHGVRREKQLTEAICVMGDLSSIVGTFRRANETERDKLGMLTAEEVVDHIETVLLPRFKAVDDYFRVNQQSFWKW